MQKTSEPKDWKPAMADKTSDSDQPVVIKKYANRRLYNTSTSSYVTLDYLCQMVKDEIDFVVLDAKGIDITRSVLTQIIVEEEAKGENLLPLSFCRQLIGFYGDNVQRMLLPHYLEYSIDAFAKNQEEIQNYMQDTFGNMFPVGQLEQMGKQNVAMFEQAIGCLRRSTAVRRPNRQSRWALSQSNRKRFRVSRSTQRASSAA